MDYRERELLEAILAHFDNSSGVYTLRGWSVLDGVETTVEIPEDLECLLDEVKQRIEDEQ